MKDKELESKIKDHLSKISNALHYRDAAISIVKEYEEKEGEFSKDDESSLSKNSVIRDITKTIAFYSAGHKLTDNIINDLFLEIDKYIDRIYYLLWAESKLKRQYHEN